MKNVAWTCAILMSAAICSIAAETKVLPPAISDFEVRRNPALSGKRAAFYIDDVIWLFRELARNPPERLFDNPFLKVLKEAHDRYGMKVQLNCFYRTDFFYDRDVGIGFKELEDYQPLSAGINLYALKDIPAELGKVIGKEFVIYSYHEQYFYRDYLAYQPDYAEKVMLCAKMLHDAGYKYMFFADLAGVEGGAGK